MYGRQILLNMYREDGMIPRQAFKCRAALKFMRLPSESTSQRSSLLGLNHVESDQKSSL